jgi:hypothetical protein
MSDQPETDQPPTPPRPPSVARTIRLDRLQLIGVPLILLVPLLAVLGVFGEVLESEQAIRGPLEVRVEYPSRMRYRTIDVVEVVVGNASEEELASVTLTIDRSYLDAFTAVS